MVLRRVMPLLIACGLAVPGLLASVTADAQTRAEINRKIEALEKQLQAVQRRVFDADSPYFRDSESGTDRSAADDPGALQTTPRPGGSPLLADMSARLEEIERQLSTLTGAIEELRFDNRRLTDRLERFERDVALRLQDLEATAPATLSGSAGGGGPTAPSGLVETPAPEDARALLEETNTRDSASVPPPASPDDLYEEGQALLRRGVYVEAEQRFRTLLEAHPDHPLAGNAQYWLGETYYVRQDYGRAAQAFLAGYQDYGDSAKAADSLLKLGMTLAALDQREDACAAFEELDIRYPSAEERIKRRMAVERTRLGCE